MNDTLRGITAKYDPSVAPQADTTVLILGLLVGIAAFAAVGLLIHLVTSAANRTKVSQAPITRATSSSRKSGRVTR